MRSLHHLIIATLLSIILLYNGLYQFAHASAAKVSDAPKLVELVEELNNPEDTNATITCSVGSGQLLGLTYEWFKDKERLFNQMSKIKIDIPSDNYLSILRVFNLKPSDSALYTCIAKNRFGQDQISTKLNVKVQLKWSSEPAPNVQVAAGRYLEVPCLATGNPEPRIEWRRINSGDNQAEDESSIIGPELRFSSVRPTDAGYYECKASNQGQDEDLLARVKLDVLGK